MRLDQHVGHPHVAREVGTLARAGGILPAADEVPGPPVERALLELGHVVRHQVGAEMVALVDDAPEVVGAGLERESGAVAEAGGVVADLAPGRIEDAHHGAILLLAPGRAAPVRRLELADLVGRHVGHADAQVRRRADGDEQALPVARGREVPGPVALGRNVADDHLGRPARLAGAGAVRIADHLVRRRHVDPLWIGGGDEGDAVGPVEVPGEDAGLRGCPGVASLVHQHPPGTALGDEDVAVRRNADPARLLEPAGEHAHREAVRHPGRRARGRGDHRRGLGHRRLGVGARHRRRRQVGRPEVIAGPRGGAPPVAEGGRRRPRRPGVRGRAVPDGRGVGPFGLRAGDGDQQGEEELDAVGGWSRSRHVAPLAGCFFPPQ